MQSQRVVWEEIQELRRGQYWRGEYERVKADRDHWRPRAEAAEGRVAELETEVEGLRTKNAELRGRVRYLEREVFGRKTEQSGGEGEAEPPAAEGVEESPRRDRRRRKRGKQPGAKGYGRKRRVTLPTEEVPHELVGEACQCPRCGKPLVGFPGTEDSEEIHYEVRLVRRVHKRARYLPTCRCGAVPGIVTAPVPPKVIPKGLLSEGFWVELLLDKYLFQQPLYRLRQRLALHGFEVSQGTLTGGLQRLLPLLEPLYEGIVAHVRDAGHWQMDAEPAGFHELAGVCGNGGEGGLPLGILRIPIRNSKSSRWLWVAVTKETCCYLLEPTRSAAVVKKVLGEDAQGILNADRYSVYHSLWDGILVAWCWSHIRRDFRRIRDEYPALQEWGQAWVTRIDKLFRLNKERVAALGERADTFRRKDKALRKAVTAMRRQLTAERKDPTLLPPQVKALKSLDRHWKGATLFVNHPTIPMDNNESERRLRNPVVGRKNYYGSGSLWSGRLAAVLFTLFQTVLKNDLDPRQWLTAYFDACARNGGKVPDNATAFLPWNLSEEQRVAFRHPKEQPP